MKAYKFLRPGAVGPFSGVAWPRPRDGRPGAWVEAPPGELVRCRTAVHACRVADLPWWIHDELWEVELGEPVRQVGHKLVAPRGRLIGRHGGWDREAVDAFARACAGQAAACAAVALEAAGAVQAAVAVRAAGDPTVAVAVLGRLEPPGPARISVAMAADAAVRAAGGHAATAAYIAAHAARRIGGEEGMGAERRRQARWLAAKLELDG